MKRFLLQSFSALVCIFLLSIVSYGQTISTSGTLTALSTTYGTASSETSFSFSASALTGATETVTITARAGIGTGSPSDGKPRESTLSMTGSPGGSYDSKVYNVATTRKGNRAIFFQRLNEDVSVPNNSTFALRNNGDGFDEEGLAITVTQDGGLLLMGFFNRTDSNKQNDKDSPGKNGEGGEDYKPIKFNAFCELQWRRIIGGCDNDLGVAERQARDEAPVVVRHHRTGQHQNGDAAKDR